ncbi:cullin-1-like isoform X2 [Rhododendron vialii]|nr:cullin-1-like isoform X2 [Rhododendron vialii]
MCIQHQSCDQSLHLSQRFTRALEESISSRVLPPLQGKNGASLLKELTSMWANYKSMAKCLGGFFLYIDRPYRTATSLCDVSFRCFRDLVCNTHYPKLQDAAIALINQDRTENPTDRSLLKCISTFFIEMGIGKDTYCYDDYERAILADTSSYYSRLASEWLALYSCVDYIKEAEWCLKKEIQRVSEYLKQSTVEKLMQVLQWQLMGQTASKLIEKQKAENQDLPAYQELLSRYSSMSLVDGTSASPMLQ